LACSENNTNRDLWGLLVKTNTCHQLPKTNTDAEAENNGKTSDNIFAIKILAIV